MSEIEDVVRWSADPDAPEGMRELLRAANADVGPASVELANLRGRMAAQLAPKVALRTGLLGLIGLLVVGVAIVGYVVSRSADVRAPTTTIAAPPGPPPPPVLAAPAPPPLALAAPAPPPPVIAEPPVAAPRPPHVHVAPPKPPAAADVEPVPAPAPPVVPTISEVALLEHARSALRGGDAAHALALVEQAATSYPDGVLVEEREALAIETLIKLGRRDEAVAKWSKFATSYPRSNYHARLQRLIEL